MKTKKLLLIGILIIGMSCTIKSQNYKPVVGQGDYQWLMPYPQLFGLFMDTVYLRSTSTEYYEVWYKGTSGYTDSLYVGKMRANETNSKLFFVAPDSINEVLIMDLDLEEGDTFQAIDLYGQFQTLTVEQVYYKDELKHIQFDDYTPIS